MKAINLQKEADILRELYVYKKLAMMNDSQPVTCLLIEKAGTLTPDNCGGSDV